MKNWQTSLAGVLTLALAGLSIWHKPDSVVEPQTIGLITTGVGLLVASDANKPKIEEPKQEK